MKRLDLEEFMQEVHAVAVDKGWWEVGHEKTPLECAALMVSEIAEAMEEMRLLSPKPYIYQHQTDMNSLVCVTPNDPDWRPDLKPEGEAVELADCILRILDYCAFHKLPLVQALQFKHEFNKTRPYRHGKKL